MKGNGCLEIAVNKIVRQEVREVLGKISTDIKTKCDSIPWGNTQYDDGRIEAFDWVLDYVIDKYKDEYREWEESSEGV